MKQFNSFSFDSAFVALLFFFLSVPAFSAEWGNAPSSFFPSKTVYFGVNLGGGSTEWSYLVDTVDGTVPASTMSTPEGVREGGPSWGAVLGYDVSKNFAIEFQYTRFADAHIEFSKFATRYINELGSRFMISKTDAYSLSGRFYAQVAQTRLRAFAAVGATEVHRYDPLARRHEAIAPYLGTGVTYSFTRHWLIETGFQYFTGFGQSELHPVYGFIPFAWDAYGRLTYQL